MPTHETIVAYQPLPNKDKDDSKIAVIDRNKSKEQKEEEKITYQRTGRFSKVPAAVISRVLVPYLLAQEVVFFSQSSKDIYKIIRIWNLSLYLEKRIVALAEEAGELYYREILHLRRSDLYTFYSFQMSDFILKQESLSIHRSKTHLQIVSQQKIKSPIFCASFLIFLVASGGLLAIPFFLTSSTVSARGVCYGTSLFFLGMSAISLIKIQLDRWNSSHALNEYSAKLEVISTLQAKRDSNFSEYHQIMYYHFPLDRRLLINNLILLYEKQKKINDRSLITLAVLLLPFFPVVYLLAILGICLPILPVFLHYPLQYYSRDKVVPRVLIDVEREVIAADFNIMIRNNPIRIQRDIYLSLLLVGLGLGAAMGASPFIKNGEFLFFAALTMTGLLLIGLKKIDYTSKMAVWFSNEKKLFDRYVQQLAEIEKDPRNICRFFDLNGKLVEKPVEKKSEPDLKDNSKESTEETKEAVLTISEFKL